ncbi:MAG TPA: NUDIX domain-containing protein [Candidatus Saccharimonadia bacterium]|nr:NUDIX domain-containing protein [Candidatus Saccharimonadia bacterium]
MQIVITCRAIIIHNGKLLMCKHNEPGRNYYNLPGGKLEPSESVEDCMKRELEEETNVTPVVGKLLFINQFINTTHHRVEFFFQIKNPKAYVSFDPAAASHQFEVASFVLADPTDAKYDLKPGFLREEFKELIAKNDDFETKLKLSR